MSVNPSKMATTNAEVCNVLVRRVATNDYRSVIDLFKSFDQEKYQHLDSMDDNDIDDPSPSATADAIRALVGLRIDDKGGIYLQPPLMDRNFAYFKCYVAEDLATRFLVGYVLFFNTLDERAVSGGRSGAACYTDDPVAVVEDLYVEPDYRAKGIATQLFRKVLQSSLERGCLSLECLILNSHSEGVSFWKRMLGERRIEAVMRRSRLYWKRRRMRQRLRLEPLKRGDRAAAAAAASSARDDETVVELDRCDMKKLLEGTDREGGGGGSGSSDHVDSEMCTRNREFEDRDHNGRKILVAKRRPKTLATEATDNIS